MLVGRVDECTRVDRLLEEARAGRGGALAICGEPGIGKTSLLDYAAGGVGEMRIVHARGVQSETTVPFAALVDLLTPLVDSIGALPERQAEALESALAIGPPRPADRLAVLVGGFNLLCAAAAAQPLLALVDDAHWLDAASAEAIGFAARRIGADPIALVIATRTPGLSGIPSLHPRPLTASQSRDLLERRGLTPTGLEEAVRDAAGNPLALVELASFDDGGFEPGRSTPRPSRSRAGPRCSCSRPAGRRGRRSSAVRSRRRGFRTRRSRRRSGPASCRSSRAGSAFATR
jgi:hypothetical protein